MNIEDFFPEIPKEKTKSNLEPWCQILYNLYHYHSIPKEKCRLFESMIPYLDFTESAETIYEKNKNRNDGLYVQVQGKLNNSEERILLSINCTDHTEYVDAYLNDYYNYYHVNEEEFNRRINRYKRVGSQKIYEMKLCIREKDDDLPADYITLYITSDGFIFTGGYSISYIEQVSIEKLGNQLSNYLIGLSKHCNNKLSEYGQRTLKKYNKN